MIIAIEFDTNLIQEEREYRENIKDELQRAIKIVDDLSDKGAEIRQVDIDRISIGLPSRQRISIQTVRDILAHLESIIGKTISLEAILDKAKEVKLSKEELDFAIDMLKRAGLIFEPREGLISRI